MHSVSQEPAQVRPENERQIQARVTNLYRSVGAFVYSTSQKRRSGIAVGFPDLVVLLPQARGVIFHETKTPHGKQSDAQVMFASRSAKSGVPYVLGGEAEAIAALQHLGFLK